MTASQPTCSNRRAVFLGNQFLACTVLSGILALIAPYPGLSDQWSDYRVEGDQIPESLSDLPGDPVRGEWIVRDADNATCLICHAIPIAEEPDPGDIGPPLGGVGSRLTAGQLRLRLVEPKRLNPGTVMPSYYKRDGLFRVAGEFQGQPIYSATDIEDVIAYLLTLLED